MWKQFSGLTGHINVGVDVREDKSMGFYRSREKMTRPPQPDGGRTPIYDFDEWSRQHYETLFARTVVNKARMARQKFSDEARENDIKVEKMVSLIFCFTLLGYFLLDRDYDKVGSVVENEGRNLKWKRV